MGLTTSYVGNDSQRTHATVTETEHGWTLQLFDTLESESWTAIYSRLQVAQYDAMAHALKCEERHSGAGVTVAVS